MMERRISRLMEELVKLLVYQLIHVLTLSSRLQLRGSSLGGPGSDGGCGGESWSAMVVVLTWWSSSPGLKDQRPRWVTGYGREDHNDLFHRAYDHFSSVHPSTPSANQIRLLLPVM